MITRLLRIMFLVMFFFGLFVPLLPAQAAPAERVANGKSATPTGLLNPDGTLKLDGSFSGAVDLRGWNVKLDSERGPVFSASPAGKGPSPKTPTPLNWSDLGGGGNGAINGTIYAVALLGGNVYVGGTFTDADNLASADYVAEWNGSSWSALGSNGNGDGSLSGAVYALAVSGSNLYVGGDFNGVNNNGTNLTAANYVAEWNGSSWSALSSNGSGGGSLNSDVLALAVDGSGNLFAGGFFTNVNNNGLILGAADYIAKWDGSNWSALGNNGSGNGSLNSAVYALAVSGSNLYVGGNFTDVNSAGTSLTAADYVARWDGSSWHALGSNGASNGSLNSTVRALAVSGSSVYVGGQFTNVNNNGSTLSSANYLAKWDGSNWSALGSDGEGGGSLSSFVRSLAVDGSGHLFVGGFFVDVNNGGTVLGNADYIARWDGANWSALGSNGSGNGSLNNPVYAMAVTGSNVYAGGSFFNVNNNGTALNTSSSIALWDGSNWSAMGSVQGSLNDTVYAMVVSGSNVYVGGSFTHVANHGVIIPAADYIAKWDGSNWSALSSNGVGGGSLGGPVYALAVDGSGNLYVGGAFIGVNNNGTEVSQAEFLAKWDGANWSALGSDGGLNGSLNGTVYALAVSGTNLYVGGYFNNVNNNGSVLTAADWVAKWDGSNWSALGGSGTGDGSLNQPVLALAVYGANVYVGGYFTDVINNGTTLTAADYVAKWDGSNWSALGSDGAANGSLDDAVYALAVDSSGTLYVGGTFINVNNNGTVLTAADYIAKWDGSNWSALGSDGFGNGSLNSWVFSLTLNGGDLYVGGYFTDVNNNGTLLTTAKAIAKWDGASWSALGSDGSGGGSLGGPHFTRVDAIVIYNNAVYAGGNFYNVNNNGTVLPNADYAAVYGLPVFFLDVPPSYWAFSWIERLYYAGITGGCSITPFDYCPDQSVTRAQMAVFLERGIHGSSFVPPTVPLTFGDTSGSFAKYWIEALKVDGITTGCGANLYCPDQFTTRAQMALFLLKSEHGMLYLPPSATGTKFTDVPKSYWAADWIEQLANEGITGGCGAGNYCPDQPVTRAQMAVFLVRTFSLP